MFANGAGINGFLEKQLLMSQRSAQNAKAPIGMSLGENKNMKKESLWYRSRGLKKMGKWFGGEHEACLLLENE